MIVGYRNGGFGGGFGVSGFSSFVEGTRCFLIVGSWILWICGVLNGVDAGEFCVFCSESECRLVFHVGGFKSSGFARRI